MRNYELTLLLDGNISETKKKAVLLGIEKGIKEAGGRVKSKKEIGKRALAYPVKKRQEGVYFFWKVGLGQDKIKNFTNEIKNNEGILRHLLVRIEVK